MDAHRRDMAGEFEWAAKTATPSEIKLLDENNARVYVSRTCLQGGVGFGYEAAALFEDVGLLLRKR